MFIIAHRNNLEGLNIDYENKRKYAQKALDLGFHVELDVWKIGEDFYLGHDKPKEKVNPLFLIRKNIWVHCKNIEALEYLKDECNCFFHNIDDYTLTSKNYIWVYPKKKLIKGCIAVLPEISEYTSHELKKCSGICTDYPFKFQQFIKDE